MTQRPSATERAYAQVKRALLDGALAPGALDIRRLADRLRMSTTPVREALVRLAAERLVIFSRQHGYSIVTPSAETLRNLYALNHDLVRLALADIGGRPASPIGHPFGRRPGDATPADEIYSDLVSSVLEDIAAAQPNDELVDKIVQTNDRLHMARHCEPSLFPSALDEVSRLAASWWERDMRGLERQLLTHYQGRMDHAADLALLVSERLMATF